MDDRRTKKATLVTVRNRSISTTESSSSDASGKAPSLKSPRTARFAEATTVNSPIEPSKKSRLAFVERPESGHFMPQPQVSDVGFGYVNRHESVEIPDTDDEEYPAMTPKLPLKSPLKSAMKTPGAAPRDFGGILSPTFREEDLVEKAEKHTAKEQKRDVAIKARVRFAKFMLRGVNFSCSLIVLAMLGTTVSIFNDTRAIPPRNSLPPWAANQKVWPQVTLLTISCVSLFISVLVFYGYYKGGHRRATKYSNWYSYFAVAWFVFSVVMWLVGAGILQSTRDESDKSNLWGWSCNQNTRRQLFQNDVSYDLICRLQNWSLLCCIIEVVVESITIIIYVIVFYRFYSKNQLRKSMATRDRARSDLYMAQLRTECAPPTPGIHIPYRSTEDEDDEDEEQGWPTKEHYQPGAEAEGVQYVNADQKFKPAPFKLQAPPTKAGTTPKMQDTGFTPMRARTPSPPRLPVEQAQRSPFLSANIQHFPFPLSPGLHPDAPQETQQEHFGAAPGETVYADVPVPGAYEAPLSPGAEAPQHYQQMYYH